MGYLGTPNRVVYEAKFFRTGLANVQAYVLRPDNTRSGPYSFVEMPAPMQGRYYFDFMTLFTDPEGEYFVSIYSPTENYQTTQRLSMYPPPTDLSAEIEILKQQIAALTTMMQSILSVTVPTNLTAEVSGTSEIIGEVYSTDLIAQLDENDMIDSFVESDKIIDGDIDSDVEIIFMEQ